MRRKSLLLITLLMAMFAPLAMNAQDYAYASNIVFKPTNHDKVVRTNEQQISKSGWLQYDNGTFLGGIGDDETPYWWTYGAMYPASMLGNNNTLTKVSFYEHTDMLTDVTITVYSGGDDAPKTSIYTEDVPLIGDYYGMHEVTLQNNVTIDPEQNLWICVKVAGYTNAVPLCLSSDANNNWIYMSSAWHHLSDYNITGYGWMIRAYIDYIDADCPKPTDLKADNITPTSASLNWKANGKEESWEIALSTVEGFDPDKEENLIRTDKNPCTLQDLQDGTTYYAYVRSDCRSQWSNLATFTTPSLCDAPFNVNATDITYHSANISWEGWQNRYTIQYSTMESLYTAALSNGIPEGWSTIDNDGDGYNWTADDGYLYSESYVNNVGALEPDNWLVSQQVPMGGILQLTAFSANPAYGDEHFAIYYSNVGGNNTENYTQISEEYIATADETIYTIDLTAFSGNGYLAIRHFNCTDMFRLYVSGFEIFGRAQTYTIENATSPTAIDNLTEETVYYVKVKGACNSGDSDWSSAYSFISGTGNVFQTDGDWNVASNWKNNVVPAEGEDVTINAACVIPANYIAIANNVTIGETGSLTIKDGGQLIHTNEGVVATMEKAITGYTGDKDNYYFISSPVYDEETYTEYEVNITYPEDVTNMLANEYDLYGFDYTKDLEWINQKSADYFYLWKGNGYLYANNGQDVTLQFTGVLNPVPMEGYVGYIQGGLLSYTEDEYDFANWNLVGNPYPCEVEIFTCNYGSSLTWVSDDFYRINGEEIVASSGVVAPMEGVFVISEGSSNIAVGMQPSSSEGKGSRSLNLNLTQNGKLIDAARVRFGEGNGMPKIQLNPNHTKLFFTKENKDFAVVYGEAEGEMPVSFKAENNGTYTLSFSNENVEFSYLHLIDNLTGNDVDVLETPSYSFEAKTTDYASRFKLVFATGNTNSDNFAYFSNGSLVINNEGNAMMNVYDVTGRLVNSQRIDGSCQVSFNPAPGVYMVQLVGGNDTKTQKIVVK